MFTFYDGGVGEYRINSRILFATFLCIWFGVWSISKKLDEKLFLDGEGVFYYDACTSIDAIGSYLCPFKKRFLYSSWSFF